MKEKLKIALLVFCMGLILLPMQNFSAKNAGLSCCKTNTKEIKYDTSSQEDKVDNPCHENPEKKNDSCKDCKSCKMCHGHLLVVALIGVDFLSTDKKLMPQTQNFKYISPEISDISIKIWQPPKIG